MSRPAISELIQRLRQQWAALDPVDEWRADIAEAIETIEALRADAERYRWLRQGGNRWSICVWDDDQWVGDARTNVDALIDAAMSGKAVTPWA